MKDGIIKGEGNSRLLKAPASIPSTYAEFRAALIAGTLPVDVLFNVAGWDVIGTLLGKANLLSDSVAAALGLASDDPTVNEAINALMAVATQTKNGLMWSTDKAKLDGVETNANNYVHPNTAGNKHIPIGGNVDSILGYSASGTAIWIQQLAAKSLLGATIQEYYGGLTTVEAALKNVVHKDTVVVLTSGASWTPPRANMLIDVWMIGGGGGGALDSYGGGGGGGAYTRYLQDFKISSSSAIPIVIGAGGAASTGRGIAGGNGGDTVFASFVAHGGLGATSYNGGSGAAGGGGGGNDGVAGGNGASGYGGDGGDSFGGGGKPGPFSFSPFAGFCPLNGILYGGAGGGGSANTNTPGSGGAGGGGRGGNSTLNGTSGTLFGAGGGGACTLYSKTPGAGYQGAIIIGYNS